MKLAWCGWDADQSNGYAVVSHELRKALHLAGLPTVSHYAQDWDALVAVSTPITWILGKGTHRRPDVVYHTMFEAFPVPDGWIENMNRSGLIWTPSQWCRSMFESQGVTTPIEVIPYGVHHDIYTPHQRTIGNKPFTFLVWGDTIINSRKNVMLAIQSFIASGLADLGPDVVRMDVKIRGAFGVHKPITFSRPDGTPYTSITMSSERWTQEQLVSWMHQGDCMVYLSAGEGFGLMPLESMATGLPVICAYNTGMMDYLNEINALCVPCLPGPAAGSYTLGHGKEMTMYQPDADAVVDYMRYVYYNQHILPSISQAAIDTARGYSWDTVGKQSRAMLERYYMK